MSRKVSNRNRQSSNSRKSKTKQAQIWNALNMNLRDIKIKPNKKINYIPDVEQEIQILKPQLDVEVGINTIKGCRGGECEYEHYHHLVLPNTGPMDITGVFDGHDGKQVATFLKNDGYSILVKHLTSTVSSADDKDGFIEAIGNTQHDWLENCPVTSGSTVVLSILVHQTMMTYNLCIGDGRFYYFNANDGELIKKEIETYDYATKEKENYTGSACNIIHQINGKVLHLDGSEFTGWQELNCQKLSPTIFDKYRFSNDDERLLNWREWKKWNLDSNANSSGRFKFPKYNDNAYRMDSLQPSRSLGIDEKAIKVGTLYMKKRGYNEFVKRYPQPPNDSEITEKLAWLQKSLEDSNPLSSLEQDWKNE